MLSDPVQQFLTKASELEDEIQEALRRCRADGHDQPTADQLLLVLRKIETMKEQVKAGTAPPRSKRQRRLSRLLADEWPLGHTLANKIIALEELFLRT